LSEREREKREQPEALHSSWKKGKQKTAGGKEEFPAGKLRNFVLKERLSKLGKRIEYG
jgi:hypothetical protein